MMRTNPSTSMQKTYDECFLTCSTAVYFEGQNNETEALRSWKCALDQIYYYNAHRLPSNYRPKTETDKALQESLRQLELQCKERVDLLEALKKSREDAQESAAPNSSGAAISPAPTLPPHRIFEAPNEASSPGWLGGGTVPPVGYSDLYRPPPPHRPSLQPRRISAESSKINNASQPRPSPSPAPPSARKDSRTPSPEKRSRMLRTLRPGNREGRPSATKLPTSMRARPPAAEKAATQAFNAASGGNKPFYMGAPTSKESLVATQGGSNRPSFERSRVGQELERNSMSISNHEPFHPSAPFYFWAGETSGSAAFAVPSPENRPDSQLSKPQVVRKEAPSPSNQRDSLDLSRARSNQGGNTGFLAYRSEYPAPDVRNFASSAAAQSWTNLESEKPGAISRKPAFSSSKQPPLSNNRHEPKSAPTLETPALEVPSELGSQCSHQKGKVKQNTVRADIAPMPVSEAEGSYASNDESDEWKQRVKGILKTLPRGVDFAAAQQILNEIVIQGDQVHWEDVAGLDNAKSALKETVVYPFLRPDLFMGLREPARGMLLFGPPGTGKTMLARAVATESRSIFFAISASSLTSKFLGESEKLVRALFALAKMLAPSIIFVDEIDSLLSSRSSSGEHEATRRIKTEFLIQWSDLAKAAAGREQSEKEREKGDASRVLVLAATNLPWAIDEAARRRFVRRQYIPLPEGRVRDAQLRTLLSHQKHELNDEDMNRLVQLTEGFSGSDITALAKDAAMGPLRSLGEKLLHMTMDEIRPIRFDDFEASLIAIRPSVSSQGLKEYEDWARSFGERG